MQARYKGLLALAVVGMIGFSASEANAIHRRGGSSGGWGSSGGYGSWGSSGGSWGSSGGSSGSWGSSGGYYRVHKHRWHSSGGSWGSSGGSSGYTTYYGGSSGGSSGGYTSYYGGSSGGSSGGYSTSYYGNESYIEGDVQEGTPVEGSEQPAPTEAQPAPAEGKSAMIGSAMLLVSVPADAKVFVNGKTTSTTGTHREYISRGLARGASYAFEVKAEMNVDGKPVTLTKIANLTSGGSATLNFDSAEPVADAQPLTTSLIVNVPADAKVYLAGNQTQQTGETREFSTNKLTAGQGWKNYTVRAEITRDGQTLTQEQVVSLDAGNTKAISFDFDGNVDAIKTAQK